MQKKFLVNKRNFSLLLLLLGTAFSLSPWATGAMALVVGVFIALSFGNPVSDLTRNYSQKLLACSIIGLGAGMNLIAVGQAGLSGLAYTAVSIAMTLFLGIALGKIFKSDADTLILISVGTAICGGSAIAAIPLSLKRVHNQSQLP